MATDIFAKCVENSRITQAKQHGLYPYFHRLEAVSGTTVDIEGHPVLMLGSNNYQSLTTHPDVLNAAIQATKTYGSGVSGSRFLNGNLSIHMQLEASLARFLNKEACIIFSSGFNANLGFLSCIGARGDIILSDRENHASIYDGIKLGNAQLQRYYHSDMADLEAHLQALPKDAGALIVTDGVFSMSGEICKLPEIIRLARKYGARVMVDDAHGLGVLGAHGQGTAEHFGLIDQTDILMGTFSKSLASLGGYVAGPKHVIDWVRHISRPFIFAAALPPANVISAQTALDIIAAHPERMKRLQANANRLRDALLAHKIPIGGDASVPIIPIHTKSELRTLAIFRTLLNVGIYVNVVVPPATPADDCLIRISLQHDHTPEQIDLAAKAFIDVCTKTPADDASIMAQLSTGA